MNVLVVLLFKEVILAVLVLRKTLLDMLLFGESVGGICRDVLWGRKVGQHSSA